MPCLPWLTDMIPGVLVFSFPVLGLISNVSKLVTQIRGNKYMFFCMHLEHCVVSVYFSVGIIRLHHPSCYEHHPCHIVS